LSVVLHQVPGSASYYQRIRLVSSIFLLPLAISKANVSVGS
jgi:hypothetical protein